jgi:hypothetical protein
VTAAPFGNVDKRRDLVLPASSFVWAAKGAASAPRILNRRAEGTVAPVVRLTGVVRAAGVLGAHCAPM